MAEQSYKFEGWLGHTPDSMHGKMERGALEPKVWEEDDVDIRFMNCGVCASDIHTLKSSKKVSFVSMGGLGHFSGLFTNTVRPDEVVGLSRRANKEREVLGLGANRYIATADEEGWPKRNARTLDLIVCMVSSSKMPLDDCMKIFKVRGTLVQVG
ncbi:hypothetical protein BDV19DRAFT_395454 [Aspergillus venezuelensis]